MLESETTMGDPQRRRTTREKLDFRLSPCAHEMLSEGTCIGHCSCAGVRHRVCIPDELRLAHCHVIGCQAKGKSTFIEHMVCHDVRQGHGVAVFDPHGALVKRLLALMPEERADSVIYVDPGDPDWVPIWNPLQCRSALGPDRVADDLVSAFKSFVDGWGDRLEHLLRLAALAVAQLPGTSVLSQNSVYKACQGLGECRRQWRSTQRVLGFGCGVGGTPR